MELAAAALGFAVALPLSWCCLMVGRRLQLLDRPTAIKIHPSPVPYTGGAAIVLTLCLGGAILGVPATALIGGVIAWFIGLIDDVRGVSPIQKLVLLAICLAVGSGGLDLEPPIRVVLLVSGLVLINSFNVIDGLDGLAAGVAVFSFMALGTADSDWAPLMSVALGSLTAFLLFNLHPAAMFLGNQGSLAVGYFLWNATAHVYANAPGSSTLRFALLLWAFPLLNLAFVVANRLIEHRPVFAGDRSHLYDVLYRRLGLRSALVVCWLIAAISAVAAVATRQ